MTLANRGKDWLARDNRDYAPLQVEINEASLHTNGTRESVTDK